MQNAENTTVNVLNVATIAEILSVCTPTIAVVENTINVSLPINESTLPTESVEALATLRSEGVNLNELFTTSVSWINGVLVASISPIVSTCTETATETATETTEA